MINAVKLTAQILATAGMIFPLAVLLYRYFKCVRPDIKRKRAAGTKGMLVTVLTAFAVSRLFFWTVGLAGSIAAGSAADYLSGGSSAWVKWDAYHYIGLIRNWYVNEGDPRFHIVFYPLYPLIGRCLDFVIGSPQTSAYIVSNVSLLTAACGLFMLSEERGFDPVFSTWILMLLPTSFYFSVPYTESVFLMCTVWCALAAERRRFALSILFGALATLSRALGAVCAVVIFYEYLCSVREKADMYPDIRPRRKAFISGAVKSFFLTCIILAGFCAYLLLNYEVTGDPFRFLTYQKEHWGQQFGSVWNTVGYTAEYAITYYDLGYRLGVWIPQFVSVFIVIALLCVTCTRIYPSDGAYALIYTYCAVSPTWLLSGPRYLFAMYPIVFMLAAPKKRAVRYAILGAEAVAGAYCAYMFAVKGSLL